MPKQTLPFSSPARFKPARLKHRLACLFFLLPCIASADTLEQLIAATLRSHPAVQSGQAQQQAATAGVDNAKWQFYPTPSLNVEHAKASASDPSYQGDGSVSTIGLQQPLWTGGRLTADLNLANAGVASSAASLQEVRQQLALRVVQSYGDWLSGDLKNQAYETSMAAHVRLRDLVRRRIEQGASADSDMILAVTRLQSVVADLSVARSQKDIALARLSQLLGRRLESAEMGGAAPRPLAGRPDALLAMALANSPALQKSQSQVRQQEAVVAARRADLSPEVFLRAERQYGNHTYANASPENRIFIGVRSRLGAGLSSLSSVDAAKAQYQAALADADSQSRAVAEQVLSDLALANSLEARLGALKASLDAAAQVSDSYDRQFLAGRKSWLDVMNAARELAQTEVQLADLEATRVVVTWRLAIYTRGLNAVLGNEP